MQLFVKSFSSTQIPTDIIQVNSNNSNTLNELKDELAARTGIPHEHFKLYHNGTVLHEDNALYDGTTVYMLLELRGGKGGFGSMLRAIGAQIEKTTNKEACRDLSGRRLRDINEEKRLKKWIAKQAERERERAERKQRRLERLRALPPHEFHDPTYDKIISSLSENVSDAVSHGLENMKKNQGPQKRKATSTVTSSSSKKLQLWMDDEYNISDSDKDDASSSQSSKGSVNDSSSDEEGHSTESSSENLIAPSNDRPLTNEVLTTESTSACSSTSKCLSSCKEVNVEDEKDSDLDIGTYDSIEKFEVLGLEMLKKLLVERGMKCGGTLRERAERLFAVKGLKPEEIDTNLLAKPQKK